MKRHTHWTTVAITDDNDLDVSLNVQYQICPAEPDVGIMQEYVEVLDYNIDVPLNEQYQICLTEAELDRVIEHINDDLAFGPDEPF